MVSIEWLAKVLYTILLLNKVKQSILTTTTRKLKYTLKLRSTLVNKHCVLLLHNNARQHIVKQTPKTRRVGH